MSIAYSFVVVGVPGRLRMVAVPTMAAVAVHQVH